MHDKSDSLVNTWQLLTPACYIYTVLCMMSFWYNSIYMYYICMLQASTSKEIFKNIASLFKKRPGKMHNPIFYFCELQMLT